MASKPWTKEEEAFLRKHYKTMTHKAIAKALGRSHGAVSNKAERMQLLKKPSNRRFWYGERLHDLKRLYPHTPNKELAKRFGVTQKAVLDAARRYGVRKNQDVAHAGRFKKGSAPSDGRPIGTVRVESDGMVRIKVNDKYKGKNENWITYQLYLWLEAGNEPPADGYFVRIKREFLSLHHTKLTADHLEVVDRAANLERNSIHNYPPELKSVMRTLGRLRKEINEKH